MSRFLALTLFCAAAFILPASAATSRLTLNVAGGGRVTGKGADDGTLLEVGRSYKFVAKPARGQIFAGWTGSSNEASATLRFVMTTNTVLNATFAPNPFPAVKGTYSGLFHDTNIVEQQSAGFFVLTVNSVGSYSARVLMNANTYRFTGKFALDGKAISFVPRTGTNEDLLARMTLDLTGGSDQLTGAIFYLSTYDTNFWRGVLTADRPVFNSRNRTPLAGSYTLLLPPDTNSPAGPPGDGYGRVTINRSGQILFSGVLADGTKAVQRVPVTKNGTWPFYLSLDKGNGLLMSWINFDTNAATTDFTGRYVWIKQSQPAVKYFSGGFTNENNIIGSRFVRPTGTNKVLNVASATVAFSEGDLEEDFANPVILGPDSKIINQGTNKLTLTFSKSSGLFSGSTTPPGANRSVPFKGAVLQKSGVGGGSFLGTNAAGRTVFLPE